MLLVAEQDSPKSECFFFVLLSIINGDANHMATA